MHGKHKDEYKVFNLMNSCITEVGRHWADKLSVIIIIITNPWFMFLVFFSPGGPLHSAVVICYSWPTNLFFTEVCVISSRSRDKVNPDTTSICQCTDLLLWGKHRQLIRQRFFRRQLTFTSKFLSFFLPRNTKRCCRLLKKTL